MLLDITVLCESNFNVVTIFPVIKSLAANYVVFLHMNDLKNNKYAVRFSSNSRKLTTGYLLTYPYLLEYVW